MLLVEYNVLENVQVITEGKGATQKKKLRGKFQKCDEQNNNGRIYPKKVLESQVKAIQEKIGDRSLVGALDHPANDAIHLSQASHLITNLWLEDNGDVMGECEILSTPNGQIVQNLIDDGVKIGISSRGVGSVQEGIKGKIVNEDFKLITFDLVSDPSTRGAFPELTESMRENSERAQAIVSKHKQDRALATTFANMIEEAMAKKKKAKKKLDPVGQEDGDIDNDGDEDETDSYLKNRRNAIRKAMTGGSKKKDKKTESREDEMGEVKAANKETQRARYRKMFGSVSQGRRAAQRAQGEPQSMTPPSQADLKRKLKAKQGDKKTPFAKNLTAKAAGENSSTKIFGQKVVEAYRNLVREDEARMSDYDIDRQKRMKTGDFDTRTDRDADMPTAGARKTAKSIRKQAGQARARYIRQTKDLYGSKP